MPKGNPGQKRKPLSEATKRKIGEKNKISQLGKKLSERTKERMSCSQMGENNKQWKGDGVGYSALHRWIRDHFGVEKDCEICGDKYAKRYDWANVTGIYNRERKNWKRLCCKCHHAIDEIAKKCWLKRKERSG